MDLRRLVSECATWRRLCGLIVFAGRPGSVTGGPRSTPQATSLVNRYKGGVDQISDNLKWKFLTQQTLDAPGDTRKLTPVDDIKPVVMPNGIKMKDYNGQIQYFTNLEKAGFQFDARGAKGNPAGGR